MSHTPSPSLNFVLNYRDDGIVFTSSTIDTLRVENLTFSVNNFCVFLNKFIQTIVVGNQQTLVCGSVTLCF